jgi:hypothetical protein
MMTTTFSGLKSFRLHTVFVLKLISKTGKVVSVHGITVTKKIKNEILSY